MSVNPDIRFLSSRELAERMTKPMAPEARKALQARYKAEITAVLDSGRAPRAAIYLILRCRCGGGVDLNAMSDAILGLIADDVIEDVGSRDEPVYQLRGKVEPALIDGEVA